MVLQVLHHQRAHLVTMPTADMPLCMPGRLVVMLAAANAVGTGDCFVFGKNYCRALWFHSMAGVSHALWMAWLAGGGGGAAVQHSRALCQTSNADIFSASNISCDFRCTHIAELEFQR